MERGKGEGEGRGREKRRERGREGILELDCVPILHSKYTHLSVLVSMAIPSLKNVTSATGNAIFSHTIFASLPASRQFSPVPTIGLDDSAVIALMSARTADI